MTDSEPLRTVFEDLIEVVHLRAKELEKQDGSDFRLGPVPFHLCFREHL